MQEENTPYLEIPFDLDNPNIFKLVQVSEQRYMLSSKDCYVSLYEVIENWIREYMLKNEKFYQDMIKMRKGKNVMLDKGISSVGPPPDFSFVRSFAQESGFNGDRAEFEAAIVRGENQAIEVMMLEPLVVQPKSKLPES